MHIIRQKKTPHLITNRTPAALGTSALCQKRPTPGRFYQSPHSGSTAREVGSSYGGLFVFIRSPGPENPTLVVCGAKTHQTAAKHQGRARGRAGERQPEGGERSGRSGRCDRSSQDRNERPGARHPPSSIWVRNRACRHVKRGAARGMAV